QKHRGAQGSTGEHRGARAVPLEPEVESLVVRTALERGVDPYLALAIVEQESGGDPRAVGDHGHSVGLFQLHDQGMGAGLSVADRQNPGLNAAVALDALRDTLRANPTLDPGTLAARSQRP